jgi:hypothetical protein
VLVDPLGKPVRPELYSDRFRRLSQQAPADHPSPPGPAHAGRGDGSGRCGTSGRGSPARDTVNVYVSTYLRPSEQGRGLVPVPSDPLWLGLCEMNLKRRPFHSLAAHSSCSGSVLSLGEVLSGWRDLNSRPLDPRSGL